MNVIGAHLHESAVSLGRAALEQLRLALDSGAMPTVEAIRAAHEMLDQAVRLLDRAEATTGRPR